MLLYILSGLLLILGTGQQAISQPETRISGMIPGGAGLKVEIAGYSDLFTWTEVPIASAYISADDRFSLGFKPQQTRMLLIRIGKQQVELVAESGKLYELTINGLLSREDQKKDIPPGLIPKPELIFNNAGKSDLNTQLGMLEASREQFLAIHSTSIIRDRNKKKVDEFSNLLRKEFASSDNAWVKNSVNYSIAYLELISRTSSKAALIEKYLSKSHPLFHHPDYMEFVIALFDKHLLMDQPPVQKSSLRKAMEAADSYQQVTAILKEDPMLKNPSVRDLVLITNLFDMYSLPYFDKSHVIRLLRQLTVQAADKETKSMASNVIGLLR